MCAALGPAPAFDVCFHLGLAVQLLGSVRHMLWGHEGLLRKTNKQKHLLNIYYRLIKIILQRAKAAAVFGASLSLQFCPSVRLSVRLANCVEANRDSYEQAASWVRCCSCCTQLTWLSLLRDLVLRYMLTLMTISCISAAELMTQICLLRLLSAV